MQTGAQAVSESCDIRYVLVLADLRFFLNVVLKLCIVVPAEQPAENGLLNLLIVFLFKKFVMEKLHGTQDK